MRRLLLAAATVLINTFAISAVAELPPEVRPSKNGIIDCVTEKSDYVVFRIVEKNGKYEGVLTEGWEDGPLVHNLDEISKWTVTGSNYGAASERAATVLPNKQKLFAHVYTVDLNFSVGLRTDITRTYYCARASVK